MPPELIIMRLTQDYGVDFEDLVGTIEGLKDDSGSLPKGWEKINLPKKLNTNSDTPDQKGSKTPSKETVSSTHLATTSTPDSTHLVVTSTPDSAKQVPVSGLPSVEQVSEWAEAAIN